MANTHLQQRRFVISVTFEKWSPEDRDEYGEPGDTGFEFENNKCDFNTLISYARDFGISTASASAPDANVYFKSTVADENQAHFEQGVDTFYCLHIDMIDEKAPTSEDIQRIADALNIRFSNPLALPLDDQARPRTSIAPAKLELPVNDPVFGYYINLDERGDFYADVRTEQEKTVCEIRAGESLGEDESNIFEDGFMKNKHDVAGLESYLKSLKIIPENGKVMPSAQFEAYLGDKEPSGIVTEDGYKLIRLEDGCYVDHLDEDRRDLTYESLEDIPVDWKPLTAHEVAQHFLYQNEEENGLSM
jgi:hypothetical protein